jgi:hypothetical protein
MCFSPKILLEPVSPWNKSRKTPEHLLGQKHCTLTPHVKAADFISLIFYPKMLRCCQRSVLHRSVTLPRIAGKTTKPMCRACYWVGWRGRRLIRMGKSVRIRTLEPEGM